MYKGKHHQGKKVLYIVSTVRNVSVTLIKMTE